MRVEGSHSTVRCVSCEFVGILGLMWLTGFIGLSGFIGRSGFTGFPGLVGRIGFRALNGLGFRCSSSALRFRSAALNINAKKNELSSQFLL